MGYIHGRARVYVAGSGPGAGPVDQLPPPAKLHLEHKLLWFRLERRERVVEQLRADRG